jgi:carbon monoxide dehydrogenase subunit G
MTLIETLELAARPEQVWGILVEHGGALPLVPGVAVGAAGRGTLRTNLAGHSVTYRGYARQHVEEEGHRVTWTLSGREVRGTGRGHAEIRARVKEMVGGGTDLRLTVLIDGRGRIAEVSEEQRDRAVAAALQRFRRALEQRLHDEFGQSLPPSAARRRAPTVPISAEDVPQLEIIPPSDPSQGPIPMSVAMALGGLLAGALAVLVWKAIRRRR